ncbi:MAG: hypothetical protein KAU50_05560 [Candidatus Marinimicrobia bacterium]|nr:hypothetical protein [Candidatus Neomarinimicrobiota bacterium]
MLRSSSLLIQISGLFVGGWLAGQPTVSREIPVVSEFVGSTIDIPEQTYYQIFDNVDGFITAQFRESNTGFQARIRTEQGWQTRAYTSREFYDLALAIDLAGPIDPEVLIELSGKPAFYALVDSLATIPIDVKMVVKKAKSRKFRGRYQGFRGQYILLKSRRGRIREVPLAGVSSLKYRLHPVPDLKKDVRLHALTSLAGMAAGEGWNLLVNTRSFDDKWVYRFYGALIGLAVSPWPVQVGRIIRAPVVGIEIPDEVMVKIQTYTYLTFD